MAYRQQLVWRYYAEYFPITLHKTTDLDPKENYIFGYHLQGILALGSIANFATEGTGFSKLFPGITSRLVALNANFWMPFHRENAMFLGICSANKESIEWIISENGKGNAAVIVIGGAREGLDAIPHKMILTLKNRKGFVKIALKHGVSMVPVISFGENEMYSRAEQTDKSLLRRIELKWRQLTRVRIYLFRGRGIFQFSFGYVPYRTPINTVVGEPIKVPQIMNPSQEDINKYHDLYVESLCELFYANRKQFCVDPSVEIVIQ